MKITVEFESLQEFENFQGGNNKSVMVTGAQTTKLHADIKDTDDLLSEGEELNYRLYATVIDLLDRVEALDDKFGNNRVAEILYKTTGDYTLKPIYSEPALKRIESLARAMIHRME